MICSLHIDQSLYIMDLCVWMWIWSSFFSSQWLAIQKLWTNIIRSLAWRRWKKKGMKHLFLKLHPTRADYCIFFINTLHRVTTSNWVTDLTESFIVCRRCQILAYRLSQARDEMRGVYKLRVAFWHLVTFLKTTFTPNKPLFKMLFAPNLFIKNTAKQ